MGFNEEEKQAAPPPGVAADDGRYSDQMKQGMCLMKHSRNPNREWPGERQREQKRREREW